MLKEVWKETTSAFTLRDGTKSPQELVRQGIMSAQISQDFVRIVGSFVAEMELPPGAGEAPVLLLVLPEAAEDS